MSSNDSGEVCSATRSGNNHADAAARGFARIVRSAIWRAMRRGHVDFVSDPETLERFRRLAHDVKIRIATHHNRNQWLAHSSFVAPPSRRLFVNRTISLAPAQQYLCDSKRLRN